MLPWDYNTWREYKKVFCDTIRWTLQWWTWTQTVVLRGLLNICSHRLQMQLPGDFLLIPLPSSLTQKPQQSHKRIGWDYCATLHQQRPAQGQIWLGKTRHPWLFSMWKNKSLQQCTSGAGSKYIFIPAACGTFIPLQFSFICCFLSIHPWLCFSFMWADLPFVYFYYYHINFSAAHLVKKTSRELMIEAGGKEKKKWWP